MGVLCEPVVRLVARGLVGAMVVAWILCSEMAAADIVHLKNGGDLEGRVEQTPGGDVIVHIDGLGSLRVQEHEIASIEERTYEPTPAEPAPPAMLGAPGKAGPVGRQEAREIQKPLRQERGFFWPPILGQRYPDFTLQDERGKSVALSDFKGRIILLEPVSMTCSACQAFLGGNERRPGPYGPITPQPGLESIEKYVERYAGIPFPNPNVMHVQLLLYNMETKTPTVEDAKKWAAHFGVSRSDNQIVLVADERFTGEASYAMIPGFQLIDEEFVLRMDSTGHQPRHDLFRELIPTLAQLVRGR